jgi:hypothetical protein
METVAERRKRLTDFAAAGILMKEEATNEMREDMGLPSIQMTSPAMKAREAAAELCFYQIRHQEGCKARRMFFSGKCDCGRDGLVKRLGELAA